MSEFTITGPGEYRTRDGRKATVKDRDRHETYPWNGEIAGKRGGVELWPSWTEGGSIFTDCDANAADIIGPWIEPEGESPAIDAGTPEQFEVPVFVEIPAETLRMSTAHDVGDYGSVAVPSALAEQREVDEARESAEALSAALRVMLDASAEPGSVEYRDAILIARAVLEVHGQ